MIYIIGEKRYAVEDGILFVEVEPQPYQSEGSRTIVGDKPETPKRHYKKRKASTEEDDGVSAFPPKKQRTCSLCHKPGHRADRCGVKGSVKVAKVRESFDGDDDE